MSHIHIVPDDFDQLRGAFDQPIAPSPRFAARLKDELMAELTASDRVHLGNSPTTRLAKGQISRVQTLTVSGWQGALMTAAAVLAVLALSFASLRWVNQRFSDSDNHLNGITHYPLASATPESGGDGTSDLDGSNYIGTSAKNYSDTPTLLNSLSTAGSVTSSNVIGDYVIRQVRDWSVPEVAAGYIEAVDLKTGLSLWTFDAVTTGNFASDGTNVFAWIYTQDSSPNHMIAIDLHTGEQTWLLVDPSGIDNQSWSSGPIYAGGIVYVSSGSLSVLAVNAVDGSLLWNEQRAATIDRSQFTENLANAEFSAATAIRGDFLYVVWEGKTLEKLDRITGEAIWSYQVNLNGTQVLPNTDILVDDQRIYLSITEIPDSISTPTSGGIDSYVIAINQSEPQELWSRDWSNASLLSSDDSGSLYVESDGAVSGVDRATGQDVAKPFSVDPNGDFYSPFASISDDTVFIANERHVIALSTDPIGGSEQQWDLAAQPGYIPIPAAISEIAPLISSTVDIWQNNLIVATTQGQIWSIAPDPSTPEPASNEVSPDLSDTVSQITVENPSPGGPWLSSVVGNLYLVQQAYASGGLQAFDLTSRELLWEYPFMVRTSVSGDGERLYAFVGDDSTGKYGVAAIDPVTGAELWHFDDPSAAGIQDPNRGPIVSNGTVYMHDGTQTFYALDAATGTLKWQVTLTDVLDLKYTAEGFESTRTPIPSFAADKSFFYVLTGYQYLSALDLATGETVWTKKILEIPDSGELRSELSLIDGRPIVSSQVVDYLRATPQVATGTNNPISTTLADPHIQRFDGATGNLLWDTEISGYAAAPESIGTSLIVPGTDGITSIALDSGQILNQAPFDRPAQIGGKLLTSGDFAYAALASETDLVIYKTDGSSILQQWVIPMDVEANGFDIIGLSAFDSGLLLTTRYGELFYIAPEQSSTPSATPKVTNLVQPQIVSNQLTFGPVSPNLSEESELYDVGLPNIPSTSTVELFGNTLIQTDFEKDTLDAFDVVSGASLWSTDINVLSQVVSDGSSVYAMSTRESGEVGLVAIDLATGEERWFAADPSASAIAEHLRPPAISDGVVYANSGLSTYFAVNAADGTVIWNASVVAAANGGFSSGPAAFTVGDTHVFVATTLGQLVAIDKSAGDISWTSQFSQVEENGNIQAAVVTSDNVVYVTATTWRFDSETPEADRTYSSSPGVAVAFEASSGAILWETQNGATFESIATVNDVLATNSLDSFGVVSLADGEVLPRIVYTDKLQQLGEIQVDGEYAYAAGLVGDDLMVFKVDGHEIVQFWRIPGAAASTNSVYASVFAWQDGLLVLAPDGNLYRIAPSSDPSTPAATPSLDAPEATQTTEILPFDSIWAETPTAEPTATKIVSGGDNFVEPKPEVTPTEITINSDEGGYGGADRSFSVGGPIPVGLADTVTSVDLTDVDIDVTKGSFTRSQIIGDIIVRQFTPDDGSTGTLQAFDVETQVRLWSLEMNTGGGFASDGLSLFVFQTSPTENYGVTSLRLTSGEVFWQYNYLSIKSDFANVQDIMYQDGLVLFTNGMQDLIALDSVTGTVAWTNSFVPALEPPPSFDAGDLFPMWGPPILSADESGIYVVWFNFYVQAIEPKSGSELWRQELTDPEAHGIGVSSITFTDDLVVVGLHQQTVEGETPTGMVTALEKTEGLTAWQLISADFTGNLAIVGKTLVMPVVTGTVDTIDLASGTRIHSYTLGWDGTSKISIIGADDGFIATYASADSLFVEIVPLTASTQGGQWTMSSSNVAEWPYIPEASVVDGDLVLPSLGNQLWTIENAR